MRSFLLPLALAGVAVANPLVERSCADSCVKAVSAPSIGSSHCASFMKTTVYPAETVTVTVTGVTTTTSPPKKGCKPTAWKRDITVCPFEIPAYATACTDTAAYSSACSCYGFTDPATVSGTTTTLTTTAWVHPKGWTATSGGWVSPTGSASSDWVHKGTASSDWTHKGTATSDWVSPTGTASCAAATTTIFAGYNSTFTCGASGTTVTVTKSAEYGGRNHTVTVTVTDTDSLTTTTTSTATCTPTPTPSTCVTDDDAVTITNGFINLLEFTGDNFNTTLAETLLTTNFTDTSDSINFLAGIPLTTTTFGSQAAFIGGQGSQPPIASVVTLNIWHDCHTIAWRWRATLDLGANLPVTGINVMIITDDKQIETNYSEFDNGAWLEDLGNPQCPAANTTVSRRQLERVPHVMRHLNY